MADDQLPTWDYWLTTWPATAGLLSRGNTGDGYPRALTPLTQDIILEFESEGARRFLQDNLRAQPPGRPEPYHVALWGYVYVIVERHAALGEALPGNSRRATYERYFGLAPDPSAPAPSLIRRARRMPHRAAVVGRMVRESWRLPRRIRDEIAHIRGLRRPPGPLTPDEALSWLRDLEAVTPAAWETLMLGAGIAGTAFGTTARLVGRAVGQPAGDLVNRLHTGLGGNESAEVGAAVERLAGIARRRNDLESAVRSRVSVDELGRMAPEFTAALADVLDRFGFHTAPELELEQPTWRQQPQQLLDLVVRQLDRLDRSPSGGGDGDDRDGRAQRMEAGRELRRRLSLKWRAPVVVALAASRWAMSPRENSKVPPVLLFDELRRVLEGVGPGLVVAGVLPSVADAVLLRYEELKAVLAGAIGPDAAELARRRAELDRCRTEDLPELLEAGVGWARPVTPEDLQRRGIRPSVASSSQENVLVGVPAGSGRVTGRVRVLRDPFDEFEPGEILVARTVDPGWSATLSCAGAVVLDIGGVVSHGAMVARELGIPCVVGVRTATSVLRTGAIVTVDGSTGQVVVDEQPIADAGDTEQKEGDDARVLH